MARIKGSKSNAAKVPTITNKSEKGSKREPLLKIQMVTTPAEFVESFLRKAIKTAIDEYGATSMRGTISVYK